MIEWNGIDLERLQSGRFKELKILRPKAPVTSYEDIAKRSIDQLGIDAFRHVLEHGLNIDKFKTVSGQNPFQYFINLKDLESEFRDYILFGFENSNDRIRLEDERNGSEFGPPPFGSDGRVRPILARRELLRRGHVNILGGTGTGKSTRVLLPILEQLWKYDEPPILIIELKGDASFYRQVKSFVPEDKFHFFSMDPRIECESFDPLGVLSRYLSDAPRFANSLAFYLNLIHPEQYGASFYARQGISAIQTAIRNKKRALSLNGLIEALSTVGNKDASEVIAALEICTKCGNVLANGSQEFSGKLLDFDRVSREGGVIYCSIHGGDYGYSGKAIAKAIIASAMVAARDAKIEHSGKHGYFIFDECQYIAAKNFASILNTSRQDCDRTALMSTQHGESEISDFDLSSMIVANSSINVFLADTRPEATEKLVELSGTKIIYLPSYSCGEGRENSKSVGRGIGQNWEQSYGVSTNGISEVESKGRSENQTHGHSESESKSFGVTLAPFDRARFRVNQIQAAFAAGVGFLSIRDDSGITQLHGQLTPIRLIPSIDRATFDECERLQWDGLFKNIPDTDNDNKKELAHEFDEKLEENRRRLFMPLPSASKKRKESISEASPVSPPKLRRRPQGRHLARLLGLKLTTVNKILEALKISESGASGLSEEDVHRFSEKVLGDGLTTPEKISSLYKNLSQD